MSWTSLEPIVRRTPHATAYLRVNNDRIVRLYIVLSITFMKELGEPKAADVQGGHGDNTGKVRLVFGANGKFPIKNAGRGGNRLCVPAFAGCPDGSRTGEPCNIISSSKSEVVLMLPILAWAKQIEPAPVAAKPAKPAAPDGAHPKPTVSGKIDAVRYLEAKGHQIKPLRDKNIFAVDGEQKDRVALLAMINKYRAKSDLAPVGLENLE